MFTNMTVPPRLYNSMAIEILKILKIILVNHVISHNKMRTFSSHKARSFCSFRCKNHRTSWTKMAGDNICHIHFLRVPFSTTVPSSMPYFLMTLRSCSMSNSSVASLPAKHQGGSRRLPLCIWHMYTRYTPWKKAPCSQLGAELKRIHKFKRRHMR